MFSQHRTLLVFNFVTLIPLKEKKKKTLLGYWSWTKLIISVGYTYLLENDRVGKQI